MAITQAMCTSFKKELLEGKHNFTNGAHTFKLALFLQVRLLWMQQQRTTAPQMRYLEPGILQVVAL